MNNELIGQHIEAILFTLGRPVTRTELAKVLSVTTEELEAGIHLLKTPASPRGIVLVDDGVQVQLRTASAVSEVVERIQKEEYARDIGKAGLETLAAILYRGPLTRSEIDFIRGVNSSQILRTLTMRGLIRKKPNPKDERSFMYEATTEMLGTLGLTHPSDLSQYAETKEKLEALEQAYRAQQENTQ